MWRVVWTSEASPWPDYADWDTALDAELCRIHLQAHGVTDATIHQIGDTP